MIKLNHHHIMILLHFYTSASFFSIFRLFLPLLLFYSSLCTAEDYFINCGSSANSITNTGQTFIGDERNKAVHFSHHKKYSVSSADPPEPLYQTARVFKKSSTYDFVISQNGTYFVRLHFCPFSSSLADAKFHVSASGHLLLTDFSLAGKNAKNCSSNTKEFILYINDVKDKFKIYFVPTSSSIAFVNAIEIFSINSNITEDTGPQVTPAGSLGIYSGNLTILLTK